MFLTLLKYPFSINEIETDNLKKVKLTNHMSRHAKYHLNCFVCVRALPAQHSLRSSGHFPFAHFSFNCGLFLTRFDFLYSLPRSLSHPQNLRCLPFPWHLLHFQYIQNVAKTQWLSRNSRWQLSTCNAVSYRKLIERWR